MLHYAATNDKVSISYSGALKYLKLIKFYYYYYYIIVVVPHAPGRLDLDDRGSLGLINIIL